MIATSRKTTLRSEELSCPSCVAKIEKALEHMDGVEDATVHFNTGRIVVQHDPNVAPAADLVKTVGDVGYTAKVTAF
jgi:copper chaperone CopZ